MVLFIGRAWPTRPPARFYAARGLHTVALAMLRNAHRCYDGWGASGKVEQLIRSHKQLREERPALGPTSTIHAPVEHLDLAAVLKVSQAVSSELLMDRLLDTLMRTAIEHAGAERGLLILCSGNEPRIAAEATIGETISVQLHDQPLTANSLSEAIVQTVLRAREAMILDDAAADPAFAADPYIRRRQARSVLCLPLVNRSRLIGVLYLENNLAPRVFTPTRISVLKLLASQAAIALENTGLYRDLAEREAKIRRLVDANIIGIFIRELDGRILEANDAFLRMIGYDREDLAAGRLRWTDLTPPEWLARNVQSVAEIETTGLLHPFEKEYFRKDGSRVPVLIGAATFAEGGTQGVAFVLDLTERKRAEAEARANEQRFREMQMALAHANRVATMGHADRLNRP